MPNTGKHQFAADVGVHELWLSRDSRLQSQPLTTASANSGQLAIGSIEGSQAKLRQTEGQGRD